MRRHPDLVRAAVLDGVYPPQVNGEQNEPEIVRRAFEQLYADCAADTLCRERHPDLRGHRRRRLIEAAQSASRSNSRCSSRTARRRCGSTGPSS